MTLSVDIAPAILTTPNSELLHDGNLRDSYWQPLEKSGFNIELHLKKLQSASLRLLQEGKTWEEIVGFCRKETTAEVKGFWLEYLCQFSVLPIPIEKRLAGDHEEIVVSYSGEPFLATITETERDGVVKDSFARIIEFLKTAPEWSMAVLISPPGWSALRDSFGRPINYLETQIYAYLMNKGQIEAVTIVTDNTLETDEDLIAWLSQQTYSPPNGEKERIKRVVGSPIFFNGNSRSLGFEQLLEEIAFVKGSWLARGKTSFAELKKQLANKDRLLEGNRIVKEIVAHLEKDIDNYLVNLSPNSFTEIGKCLADALVMLSASSTETDFDQGLDWHHLNRLLANEQQRRAEMERISSLWGCSGGGLAMMVVWGPTGPRFVSVEKKGRFRHCGGCSKGRDGQEFGPEEKRICDNAVPA